MDSILKRYFSQNERLLNTEEFYDVKIYIGVEPNIKEIHAHSSIICAQCPFFRNELINGKKENGYYIVKKTNIDEPILKFILK